jgi:hypothetical protein
MELYNTTAHQGLLNGPGHMKVDTCGKRYLHTFLTLKLD